MAPCSGRMQEAISPPCPRSAAPMGGGLLGRVFKISTNGPSYTLTMLYDFNVGDPTHGALPYGGLVQGSDGNFYGTTSYDGTNACLCGTVFRITTNGTLTTLYEFG